jgi:hypothetical protein
MDECRVEGNIVFIKSNFSFLSKTPISLEGKDNLSY